MNRAKCSAALLLVLAPMAAAQDGGRTPLPSLDELLGLVEPGAGDAGGGPVDIPPPGEAALDRELTSEEMNQELGEAVSLMRDTARRLDGSPSDTGIRTQRLQEDILRRLDQVIESAQNQQQGGGGSGSSSRPQQQQQQQASQPQPQNQQGEESDEASAPPGLQEGALNPEVAADTAAWGALPERVRSALVQGLSDQVSSLYERLTRDYYKRLAEQEGER